MSQSLRTISADALRLEVYKISNNQIKRLMEEIYELKRSSLGNYIALDLERKETILEAELMRRKYLMPKAKPEELQDYHDWKFKFKNKRRIF